MFSAPYHMVQWGARMDDDDDDDEDDNDNDEDKGLKKI